MPGGGHDNYIAGCPEISPDPASATPSKSLCGFPTAMSLTLAHIAVTCSGVEAPTSGGVATLDAATGARMGCNEAWIRMLTPSSSDIFGQDLPAYLDTHRVKKYHVLIFVRVGGLSMTPRFSEPLFVISVAARLVEMHPQTLRKYEREGLIAPSRTTGNLRLYSDSDIERLRQVKYLVEERGLNLAGVQLALELTRQLQSIRQAATSLPAELAGDELAGAFDDVLKKLGFVEQSQVRSQRQRSS